MGSRERDSVYVRNCRSAINNGAGVGGETVSSAGGGRRVGGGAEAVPG